MTVRVGFSTSSTFLSRMIRLTTRSPISHAFLLLELDTPFYGQLKWVLEATNRGGFHLLPFEGYLVGNTLIDFVTLEHPVDVGIEKAMGWLGGGYDYGGVFGDLFVMAQRWAKSKWKWLKFKVRNPFHEARTMYCSEAIIFVLQASQYPGSDKLIGENDSPKNFWNFLKKGVVPNDA